MSNAEERTPLEEALSFEAATSAQGHVAKIDLLAQEIGKSYPSDHVFVFRNRIALDADYNEYYQFDKRYSYELNSWKEGPKLKTTSDQIWISVNVETGAVEEHTPREMGMIMVRASLANGWS